MPAQAREKHFHLLDRGVLGLVHDDKGVVQGAAAHIGQGRHFHDIAFEQPGAAVRVHEREQSVVNRPQIGVHLLLEIAGQKSEIFSGFHGGATLRVNW